MTGSRSSARSAWRRNGSGSASTSACTTTTSTHRRWCRSCGTLHQRLRRKLIVVWDRLNVHRSAAAQLKAKGEDWLQVEWLPAYAPELNPVEAMWSHTKVSDLANFVPDDVGRLEDGVVESLSDQYYDRRLKRGYFHAARLEL
jgi:putative transposase